MIGSVVSCTDAASVFSIFRSKNLNLEGNLAPLLEIESGSNDPFSYMLTVIALTVMKGGELDFIWKMVFLRLAAALTSYALAGILGGNGFLSVYLTGILMGNAKTKNKANVVRFFDNVTILAQIATFFLIGLLSYPSQMVSSLPATLVIILFLTLAARPAMVFILTERYLKFREKIFVSFAGLRGASSIVFAIFASAGGVYMQSNVFHIVFGLSLMQLHISSGHHWENQKLKDVTLPEGSLAMVIRREDDIIIPKGDTVMMAGDDIAVNVPSFEAANEISLREITIEEDHPWRDKKIRRFTKTTYW